MNLKVLAQNVRRLRAARRLSQGALAEAASLSLPAIKKLELAKNEPRMRTVQSIATALDVKTQELFLPVRELNSIRFRSAKRMQFRENILAKVSRWLEDYDYLEKILNKPVSFKLKHIRKKCDRESIIECAHLCREKLKLKPREPIHDICGLLEHAGVKVFTTSFASSNFFGLSVGDDDDGPAVVVNVWERIPVERRIFSAAHELAHLILHLDAFDVTLTKENKKEESEADLFSGHFLMPNEGFRKEWNDAAGLHWVDRVFKVKRIFRVSYKTVLFRLIELGIVNRNEIWRQFQLAYQSKFHRTLPFKEEPMAIDSAEPFGFHNFDFYEDRFSKLTREAVISDKISLSRGAEILGITIEDMSDLLNDWEVVL